MDTVFGIEGYHDLYNFSAAELKTQTGTVAKRKYQGKLDGHTRTYEFIFIPNSGFLNSNLPLMTNTELKLSFDRVNAEVSMLEVGDVTDSCAGSPFEIKDCVAISEYVMSDELEKYFMQIDNGPIPYNYQDCDVILKTIPLDETNIRLHNIKGGNIPDYMFVAIIPSSALNGNFTSSSTSFGSSGVTEINITLNGNSVNGYPVDIRNDSSVYPYYKFMDVTGRYMNPTCGEGLRLAQFAHNWVYAHKFEAETSLQGWLGIHLKVSKAFTEPQTLVIWSINDCALTIDKFHQIEKLNCNY